MIRIKESDLLRCCGSTAWALQMAAHAFPNPKEVLATADSIWWSLPPEDWREAFQANIRVGERGEALRHASETTAAEIRLSTVQYERQFGYLFVVCANGRSAHTLLEVLKARLTNEPDKELRIAAEQQLEITHTRLKRILTPGF
jgi:OHCU decarboxylase